MKMVVTRDERFLALARKYFDLADLVEIMQRMIGTGLIGGKSLGMLLARAILREVASPNGRSCWRAMTRFSSARMSSTPTWCRTAAGGCGAGRRISTLYLQAGGGGAAEDPQRRPFPDYIQEQFMEMLEYFGQSPLIVRSSSLLEDNYGNAFSGKYESVFLANQGTPQERLEAFMKAVRTVYASAMSEEGLRYRQHHGLLDRDEQMALLVQRVSGEMHGQLFFPACGRRGLLLQPLRLERGHRSPGGHAPAGLRPGHARGGPHRRRLHAAGRPERPAAAPGSHARTRCASSPSAGWTCWT